MSRLSKLKKENIKKANELLDNGHTQKYEKKDIPLKPSHNVTSNSPSFINKMNGLKESVINEEPEKGTYWIISKEDKELLDKMGGEAGEIGKSATNDFSKYCR